MGRTIRVSNPGPPLLESDALSIEHFNWFGAMKRSYR